MTNDEADHKLLKHANEKGKFAIPMSEIMPDSLNDAFERGIDNEWFTLVDVGPIAIMPWRIVRTFRLTAVGWKRLEELDGQEKRNT